MTITNKAIIERYKTENGLPVNYPLFTYAAWLKQGYQVKKGENKQLVDVFIKLCHFLTKHK